VRRAARPVISERVAGPSRCYRRWRAALPSRPFFFEGFCHPPRPTARVPRLKELARIHLTLVMFESGNRVRTHLPIIAGIMEGQRRPILPGAITNA